ncbi:hypothetical protein JB92DRAFT_886118 [Gautieria morchelliformis]|nr:hypothetical protein JB92DRAFT_886118 [Gautieria morchelliformis]
MCIEEGNFTPEAILGALLRDRSPITDTNSELSAGFQCRRYRSEKAIKWLPVKLLNTLDADGLIQTRTMQHLLQLEVWQSTIHPVVGTDMQVELFKMLEDALEMSRTCYSRHANKCASLIGLEIQRWIILCPGASLTKETAPWLCRLHVGLFPIFFGGNTDLYGSLCVCGEDLSMAGLRFDELLNIVTGTLNCSQPPKATSNVIKIMSKSLGSMPYICPYTPLLGENLVRLIDTVSQMRVLDEDEINALRRMAVIRLEWERDIQ